jgi:hypothetical protein
VLKTVTVFFRSLASLKVAIPLLVLTVVVTIIASLFPRPDLFRSWWYLGLLGLNGLSLVFITLMHIPSILRKKGRNALIGVVATHMGILFLLAGVIYGGISSFRHDVRLIEGEVTIVPGLGFALLLEELLVEEYAPGSFVTLNPGAIPKKRQESRISLLKNGEPWREVVAAPGRPVTLDGLTLLPALNNIGWYFELIVTDPNGREKTIPISPWGRSNS